jgi:hypothetical protein
MLEISVKELFGRDPIDGIVVADSNCIAAMHPERSYFLSRSHRVEQIDGGLRLNDPGVALGVLVRNYKVIHVDCNDVGTVTIKLKGDIRYANAHDFKEMLRIPTGVGSEQLLKALYREMDSRES